MSGAQVKDVEAKQSDRLWQICLLVLLVTTWLNGLKLQAIGLHSNPLLVPSIILAFLLTVKFFKAQIEKNGFWHFLAGFTGIWPFEEDEPTLVRLSRFLYFVLLLSSFATLTLGFDLRKNLIVRLVLFFILMVLIPSYHHSSSSKTTSMFVYVMRTTAILTGISGLAAFVMLLGTVQVVVNNTVIGIWDKGLSGLYLNPNQAGVISVLGIISSLYLAKAEDAKALRVLAWLAVAMQGVVIVFSNSRTSLLGLVIGMMIYLIICLVHQRSLKDSLKENIPLIILALALLLSFVFLRPYIQENYLQDKIDFEQYKLSDLEEEMKHLEDVEFLEEAEETAEDKDITRFFYFEGPVKPKYLRIKQPVLRTLDSFLSGRVQLAMEAWLLWRTKPITGYGFRHFYEAYSQRVNTNGILMYGQLSSAHNVFVDLLWMGGIVGLVIGFAILFQFIKRFFNAWRCKQKTSNLQKLQCLTLLFSFFFINQMLEVSVITAFNINTFLFWMTMRGLAMIPLTKEKKQSQNIVKTSAKGQSITKEQRIPKEQDCG